MHRMHSTLSSSGQATLYSPELLRSDAQRALVTHCASGLGQDAQQPQGCSDSRDSALKQWYQKAMNTLLWQARKSGSAAHLGIDQHILASLAGPQVVHADVQRHAAPLRDSDQRCRSHHIHQGSCLGQKTLHGTADRESRACLRQKASAVLSLTSASQHTETLCRHDSRVLGALRMQIPAKTLGQILQRLSDMCQCACTGSKRSCETCRGSDLCSLHEGCHIDSVPAPRQVSGRSLVPPMLLYL